MDSDEEEVTSQRGTAFVICSPPETTILLMVQKSHSAPPGMVLKPVVNKGDKLLMQWCRISAINSST